MLAFTIDFGAVGSQDALRDGRVLRGGRRRHHAFLAGESCFAPPTTRRPGRRSKSRAPTTRRNPSCPQSIPPTRRSSTCACAVPSGSSPPTGVVKNQLFYSENGGESWTKIFEADADMLGFALSPDGAEVFVGLGSSRLTDRPVDPASFGLYRSPTSALLSSEFRARSTSVV